MSPSPFGGPEPEASDAPAAAADGLGPAVPGRLNGEYNILAKAINCNSKLKIILSRYNELKVGLDLRARLDTCVPQGWILVCLEGVETGEDWIGYKYRVW